MSIERFDQIPGLFLYFNGGESDVQTSGDVVTSVEMTGSAGPISLVQLGVSDVMYNPATVLAGMIPALYAAAGSDAGLGASFVPLLSVDEPWSFVAVVLPDAIDSGNYAFRLSAGSSNHTYGLERINSDHNIRVRNSSRGTEFERNISTPDVVVSTWNLASEGQLRAVINGIENPDELSTGDPPSTEPDEFVLMNRLGGVTDSFGGRTAIVAVYNAVLNDTQIADLTELCDYWIANNSAPVLPENPPMGVFGPVATNDDPNAVLLWQASIDGIAWDDADNVLSDVSGVMTDTLTVHSATFAENGYYVRCYVTSTYDPVGTASNTARLTVIA